MIAFKTLRSQILFISMGEYLLNTPNVPFMYELVVNCRFIDKLERVQPAKTIMSVRPFCI